MSTHDVDGRPQCDPLEDLGHALAKHAAELVLTRIVEPLEERLLAGERLDEPDGLEQLRDEEEPSVPSLDDAPMPDRGDPGREASGVSCDPAPWAHVFKNVRSTPTKSCVRQRFRSADRRTAKMPDRPSVEMRIAPSRPMATGTSGQTQVMPGGSSLRTATSTVMSDWMRPLAVCSCSSSDTAATASGKRSRSTRARTWRAHGLAEDVADEGLADDGADLATDRPRLDVGHERGARHEPVEQGIDEAWPDGRRRIASDEPVQRQRKKLDDSAQSRSIATRSPPQRRRRLTSRATA